MNTVHSSDGTTIAFDQSGEGPPIILVDGAFCYRTFGPMPKLAPLLAPHFTVFSYNRRGRGDSGDTKPYAVEREIEDLAALLKEAGGSAYVFGTSSGAALALKAADHGLNITKLALYEPPFMVEQDGPRPPADAEAQLTAMIAADCRGKAVKCYLTKVMGAPSLFVTMMQFSPDWSNLKGVANSLPYDIAIMGDFFLPTKQLASVVVPALVIGGEKSDVRLRHAVPAVANALPNAKQRMLVGQSHNVSMKVLAPVLVEFFQG